MTHRALPGWAVDLIRDGTPEHQRNVFAAVLSTANSALQRGWTRAEWAAMILDLAVSRLGRQLSVERGKTRPQLSVINDLHKAWAKAVIFCDTHPAHTADDYHDEINAVRDWYDTIRDHPTFTPAEHAVLAHAIATAARNGSARPTMPRRAVMAATGLTERQVRNALLDLHLRGVLVCEERGRPGGPNTKDRRAACYRLPSAEARARTIPPKSRDMGQPPREMWGAPIQDPGAAPETSTETPSDLEKPMPDPGTVTLTLTATPEALGEVMGHLQQLGLIAGAPPPAAGRPKLRIVPDLPELAELTGPEAGTP